MSATRTRAPRFGEWFEGIYASEQNPQKRGMYVRTIRRSGRLNPGTFYELTDGRGAFWQYPADNVVRVADSERARLEAERIVTLTREQLDSACERFEDAYLQAYEAETSSRYTDQDDRQRAHHAAVRAALTVVLTGPAPHAAKDDDGKPLSEADLMRGYGVDETVRKRRVPHALKRDLGLER